MIAITIIAVGKLKERFFADAVTEYCKRLGAFCKLSIAEVDEYRLPQNPSDAQIEKGLLEEGKAILSKIPQRAHITSLCIEGKTQSSEELAADIAKVSGETSQIVFVIGSSHGLSDEVKEKSHKRLSMSPMTFPHQLARVMLCEQLYRACSITAGGKYHK